MYLACISQERLTSLLKDEPTKKSIKSLYRSKPKPRKPTDFGLRLTAEPSAFTLQPQVEQKLDGLQLTWRASSKWKEPPQRGR